jgi:hypothetical protein
MATPPVRGEVLDADPPALAKALEAESVRHAARDLLEQLRAALDAFATPAGPVVADKQEPELVPLPGDAFEEAA